MVLTRLLAMRMGENLKKKKYITKMKFIFMLDLGFSIGFVPI